jgi:hypothetical protein
MQKGTQHMSHQGNNLLILILIWLGVLTGAIITMLLLQRMQLTDVKSDIFTTPSYFYTTKPGPDPWITITKPGPDPWFPVTTTFSR